jgi:hypothetical protein
LDAEIEARQALIGNKQKLVVESDKSEDQLDQVYRPSKQHNRLVLPIMEDYDLLYPASNAKRSSNLLRLANQSARGFGKK